MRARWKSIRPGMAMAGVLGLCAAGAVTRAETCPTFGWAEGLPNFVMPGAAFPTQDTANTNATDCVFHQWSWEAFAWATAIDPTTRQARFLGLKTQDDFDPIRAAGRAPGVLNLKLRKLKPRGADRDFGTFTQAGSGGILVDQTGQPVFYSVHMNPAYFNFAKPFYGVSNFSNAPANLNFPVGSAVFKASWRVLTGVGPSPYYTTKATVPILVNTTNAQGQKVVAADPKATRVVTVGLVGLHVVGVTVNHPEFLWATFEQVGNAPNLPAGMATNSTAAVSKSSFALYRGGTAAANCNLPAVEQVASPRRQTIKPAVSIFRQYAHGGESVAGVAEIDAINAGATNSLLNFSKANTNYVAEAVWAGYRLIGTVWLGANSLQPGDGNLEQRAFGSVNLANATMESYVQGPQNNGGLNANCFQCHNTAGSAANNFPAKNIGTSHVLDAPFFP